MVVNGYMNCQQICKISRSKKYSKKFFLGGYFFIETPCILASWRYS